MNVLVKHSILQHLQHIVYSKTKNQYHIQTVAAEGTNGTWTSTDLLRLVTIIVTTLLCKQVNKSGIGKHPSCIATGDIHQYGCALN